MGELVVVILIVAGLIAMFNIRQEVRPASTHPDAISDEYAAMLYVGIGIGVIILIIGLLSNG